MAQSDLLWGQHYLHPDGLHGGLLYQCQHPLCRRQRIRHNCLYQHSRSDLAETAPDKPTGLSAVAGNAQVILS